MISQGGGLSERNKVVVHRWPAFSRSLVGLTFGIASIFRVVMSVFAARRACACVDQAALPNLLLLDRCRFKAFQSNHWSCQSFSPIHCSRKDWMRALL